MYAPQCHPGPRCSNCSAPLWSHCELRSYRVQGQELMERQLGQHFRGNWDKCWTSPGFRLSAWHRWSSSPLAFIACIFTLQSPPLSAPPPSSQRFSHLLPLLYHLIKTLLNPAAASSASGPQEIPSGIICVFVCSVCLLPVRVCGFSYRWVFGYILYLHILVLDAFVLPAPEMCLSSLRLFRAC